MCTRKDYIRAARLIAILMYDDTPAEVHDKLINAGLSESEAYLTYMAAKLVRKNQERMTLEMFAK